ncbi:MAG: sensor histidine kinase [Clostridia bacterium]|nr:sensor histidine kinase [Clostridia bacterium]
MPMKGITRRWFLNNYMLILLSLVAAVTVFGLAIRYFYYSNITSTLVERAKANADMTYSYIGNTPEEFNSGARRYAMDFEAKNRMELQVVSREGEVICSSTDSLLSGFVPGTPDVGEALDGLDAENYVGRDSLTGQRVLSVSVPVYLSSGEPAGVLRYVTGLENINRAITRLVLVAVAIAAGIAVFVLISNRYFIKTIVSPIREINRVTKKIAAGEYGVTIQKSFNDEVGELAEAINFMSVETERSIKVKNDFISSVSHELRTPLTAISGWADTLLAGGIDPESTEGRGLAVIANETANLRRMVEELLDFSRMESGRLKISLAPMDVAAELADAIFMFEQRLKQDGIVVFYHEEIGNAVISGDRGRLRQVFVNIMDNARKYSPPQSSLEVVITAKDDKYAVIKFVDHGEGIAPGDLPHVKEKFYKGKTNRPGSGIGLALSDEIVSLHGGRLDIESTLGMGTTVTVTLPLYKK